MGRASSLCLNSHIQLTYTKQTDTKDKPDMQRQQQQNESKPLVCGAVANGLNTEPQLTLFETPQTNLTSDDYYTPKWIFDLLDIEFDIDVASPPDGPMHTPCKKYFTQLDNGINQDWVGSVFLNPPFSEPKLWVDKWIRHQNGVLLAPMAKSKWFNTLWNSNATLVALPSNLRFADPKGGNGSIMLGCVIAALGDKNIKALSNLGKVR